jgi:hypothetical protein
MEFVCLNTVASEQQAITHDVAEQQFRSKMLLKLLCFAVESKCRSKTMLPIGLRCVRPRVDHKTIQQLMVL